MAIYVANKSSNSVLDTILLYLKQLSVEVDHDAMTSLEKRANFADAAIKKPSFYGDVKLPLPSKDKFGYIVTDYLVNLNARLNYLSASKKLILQNKRDIASLIMEIDQVRTLRGAMVKDSSKSFDIVQLDRVLEIILIQGINVQNVQILDFIQIMPLALRSMQPPPPGQSEIAVVSIKKFAIHLALHAEKGVLSSKGYKLAYAGICPLWTFC